MTHNFDQVIDRFNTSCGKWDEAERLFGVSGLLPMWVADMDFKAPEPVLKAMQERVEHGVFGYTTRTTSYYEAVIEWMERRHEWTIEKDWISFCPGVVPALSYCIQAFTEPGDKVVIQPPVYHPFTSVIEKSDRQVVLNPLKLDDDGYTMDFEDLRGKLDSSVKLLILCNPHNPVGRVWTKEELTELGSICMEHNILVVSDEIHGDLIFEGHKHIPFAAISDEFAQNTIVCTAPSKTFNLAGLQTSNIIIPNERLRKVFNAALVKADVHSTNTFGVIATEAAYKDGDEWLDALIAYLQQNLQFLTQYIEQNMKGIKVIQPEGTYLAWLDCRGLGMDKKELEQFMLKEAKVAFNQGYSFGEGGEGFVRMNFACPRSVLEEGLQRMEKALHSLSQ